VNSFSKVIFETLKTDFPNLEFRFRDSIDKKEINEKLNSVDSRLGITIFIEKASIKPDGTEVILKHDAGSLNRIDRLTSANYSLPINQNSCENIFITIDEKSVMLQAVSIYTKPTEWTIEEMLPIMIDVSKISLKILRLTE
jgi:hypothetical protein